MIITEKDEKSRSGGRAAAKSRRKRRRWIAFSVVVTLVTAAAVTGIVFRALPAGTYQGLDRTDRSMFDRLAEQYEAFATHPDEIWTSDYRYDHQPLVLLRTDGPKSPLWHYSYLVNMSDLVDTSNMQKVDFPGTPGLEDVYVSNTFEATNPWLWAPANFTPIEIGGREVLAFKFHEGMLGDTPPDGLDFETFSMHEAFHIDKQANWTYDADFAARVFDFPFTPEHHELLRTEFAILDRATKIDDDAVALDLARDLAAIRAARYERWPQLEAQDNAEAIEGTATYLEHAFRELVPAPRDAPEASTFVEWLDKAWDDPALRSALEYQIYYYTGAQLGRLLDRVAPEWKHDMEPAPAGKGWTPAESLRQATATTTAPSDTVIAEIQARYLDAPSKG